VGATSLLTASGVPATFVLLGVALVAVNVGSVTYDALLPFVSTERNRGLVSGLGVGVGYLGSFIGLGIGAVTLSAWGYLGTFRSLAAGFLLFSLPIFLLVRETASPRPGPPPPVRTVASDLVAAWGRARRHPGVVRFLTARFLYTDAINTLLGGFLTIFLQTELGFAIDESRTLLAIAIVGAMIGGFAGGAAIRRFGPRRVLGLMLALWVVAIACGVLAAVAGTPQVAWAIGPLGGIALGGTWAADRVVMTRISPPRHLGEFYGLYATVGRFATIVGPAVWAVIVDGLHLGREVAVAALGLFVAAGWTVLRGVDDSVRTWPQELK
jgi:UMF1 family MFS transporter